MRSSWRSRRRSSTRSSSAPAPSIAATRSGPRARSPSRARSRATRAARSSWPRSAASSEIASRKSMARRSTSRASTSSPSSPRPRAATTRPSTCTSASSPSRRRFRASGCGCATTRPPTPRSWTRASSRSTRATCSAAPTPSSASSPRASPARPRRTTTASRLRSAPRRAPRASRFTDNFTLISDPQVYRWFAFQNGQSAKWYSSGTQSGYTGGGVNEISTAMAAWTGYTSALIRYSYAGVESGTPKPIAQTNGVNEVLFNDPFQEISGTFTGSGVVGVGGFNGVSGSSSWTGPFDADAQHRAIAYTAYNIVEAGLTIQDGVSPSTGVSSAELAEIVAHEFGHTLGLGHSTDSTALMYPTVTGLGASLRTDDQLAARWLYPNGSAPPPPPATVPAAPSGLTATPSGTQVTLNWSDNATNETGESVYYAVGNGAFVKVTDVAASVRTSTLTGFSPGTYRFYVTAYNSAGESPASNIASATIASSTRSWRW